MEARYVEAGSSMSIFWTQNRALKTTSLARADTYLPNRARRDPVGPSSPLRGAQIGFGGTRWDPVGPSPSLRGTLHPVTN